MKLIRLGNGVYRIVDQGKSIEAGYAKVTTLLRFEYEVDLEDLNAAIEEMSATGNDGAEFDEYGWFLRTFSVVKERNIKIELEAVKSLREEFDAEYKRGPESRATKDAYNRLMSLYMSLDVDGVLKVLDRYDEKKVA